MDKSGAISTGSELLNPGCNEVGHRKRVPAGRAVGTAEDPLHRKGLAPMSQENQITLRGYLTAEPKLYQKTATAIPVTEIRVGSTPRRLNRETGEWENLPTSYYRIKCWRRLAINAVSSLHKGDQVIVRGRFYMNHWVDSQQRPRATLEIEADSLGHDLTYGWSHFLRGTRPSGSRADVDTGETARQDTELPEPDDSDDEFPPDIAAIEAQQAGFDLENGADDNAATEVAWGASGLTGDANLPELESETRTEEDAVSF